MKTISIFTFLLFSCIVHAQEKTNSEFSGVAREFNILSSVEIPVRTFKTAPKTKEFTFSSLKKLSLKDIDFSSEKGFSFIDSQPEHHNLANLLNRRFKEESVEENSELFPLVLVHIDRCD